MVTEIATFYGFFPWPNFEAARDEVLSICNENEILGTILVAHEGINATICGESGRLRNTLAALLDMKHVEFSEPKFSTAPKPPFRKLKVKIKPEIVTMGVESVEPARVNGTYVKPADWNTLISDPSVTVIDTRNDYEFEIGSFEHAVNPETEVFRDFPSYVQDNLNPTEHKKVALFCTGGIRCEKATSHLIEQGFDEVYHLEGGIIKYLEEVPASESLWNGDCYVFDDRVTVTHGMAKGKFSKCTNCGMPVDPETDDKFEPEVCCAKCVESVTPERRQRREMRLSQIEAASQQ